MGAKIPDRPKTRPPTCKCEVCGCSFLSIQALRSHQACVHPRSSKRVAYKPKIEVIARRKLVPMKKTMKPANTNVKLIKTVEKSVSSVKSDDGKPYNTRRTEFECPVCTKIFKVYFSAYRHIQKNHCINDDGESVPANSSDLIQPTRIELCTSCNMRVATNLPHTCSMESLPVSYACQGCEQSFSSLHMFEVHIPGLHCDEAEKYTFPDLATYTAWKEDMESQTKIKYVKLNNQDSKQIYYHCEHKKTDDKTTHYCPSSLSVQELPKEVRVSFYEVHFGHDLSPYKIPEKYKKYLTALDDSEMEMVTKSKDTVEIYGEFKQLMNNIIVASEKIDVNGLKTLVNKAVEMSSLLKKYEEHVPDVNKSITDDEISKLLDKPLRKRKLEVEDSIAKRLRKDRDSLSQKSEPEQKKEDKPQVKEIKTYTNPKKLQSKEEDKKEMQSPSSFNESYKNFVDASYKSVEKNVDKSKSKGKVDTKKKEVVKTKVGQFKPVSPKETNVVQVKPNILNKQRAVQNDSPKMNKSVQFVMTPKEKPIDTNMVQIKPNMVQKDSKMQVKMKDISDLNLPKIKPDFEYEVKEQNNDCNILIIKI